MPDDRTTPSSPRVAIAIPSGDMVHAGFAMALADLCYASRTLDLQLTSAKSSIIALARNNAVAAAQRFGADFLLFLDADMVFPRTTLLRLLVHAQDVVGATYVRRVAPFSILGTALAPATAQAPSGLVEMERIPTGCLLIRMRVFDRLTKPYFRFATDVATGVITGEDYVFCDAAREAGFRIWCDATLSAEVGHIGQTVFHLADAQVGAS